MKALKQKNELASNDIHGIVILLLDIQHSLDLKQQTIEKDITKTKKYL